MSNAPVPVAVVPTSPAAVLSMIVTVTSQLEAVTDPYEANRFRKTADALAYLTKKAKLSDELQDQAAECSIRATRRLGELLAEVIPHEGGNRRQGKQQSQSGTVAPTLEELGLSKNESARAQVLAALPEGELDATIAGIRTRGTGKLTKSKITKIAERKARTAKRAQKPAPKLPPSCEIVTADLRDYSVEPGSVDAVVTDPPYSEGYMDLWPALAEWASDALRPGGHLLAMSGQLYLPNVMRALCEEGTLTYWWTIAYLTPGGQAAQIWPRKVETFWKPVIWMRKGETPEDRWVGDVTRSDPNDNDKKHHEWGQSFSGMRDLLRRVVEPGWLVADPMCGAGTTGAAALDLSCRFIGVEVDDDRAHTARTRLAKLLK